MAKIAVSQWDTTANNNTDVGGISLAENVMQPPAVNDAIREIMAQIASGVMVKTAATTTVSAYIQLAEATNNGINKLTVTPAASLTADRTATFPDLSGTVLYADAAQTVSAVHTFSALPILSGGGISFPATQVPSADANTLDDYEEGTFTPTFVASGSTFGYAAQSGTYTKIGRLVFAKASITLQASGTSLTANPVTLAGLPFTSGDSARGSVYWFGSTTSYVNVQYSLASGATVISFQGLTAAAVGLSNLNASTLLSTTGGLHVNIVYTV